MSRKTRIVLIASVIALVLVGVLGFCVRTGATVACGACEGTGLIDQASCETCGGTGLVAPESRYYATFMALLPPLIAITLALITKEVYSSLFVGIVAGAMLNVNFAPVATLDTLLTRGFIAKLADSWNMGILLFLVLLGAMVALVNKAGGSAAFGAWAKTHIKTRVGAQLATFALGVLIFVDDYFNCLTVGSVMKPVTDSHHISRAKLAYLIDATAAPICMIAPISSWAAAVAGVVEGENGLALFIRAIPYNFYSLLTIVMIVTISLMNLDYGPMKRHERLAMEGDLFGGTGKARGVQSEETAGNGKMIDLLLPVVLLIVCCVTGMIYTGGFFNGVSFVDAFAGCDASVGLPWGALIALIASVIYLLCRGVISFKDAMDCLPKGFIAMVPAILILSLAWTLGGMTNLLGADVYVADMMTNAASGLSSFLPAIVFLVAVGLAFATGTSWGTFGILLPIVVAVFQGQGEILTIGISACLAGAVCGDHCSPISDTTIMASAGSECNHVQHVSTQLPYALTVAAVSFVCYLLSGWVRSWYITLPVGIVLMVLTLLVIRRLTRKEA